MRVAAVGDIHFVRNQTPGFFDDLARDKVDLLLLAGDLTDEGKLEDVLPVCREMSQLDIPVCAVLGNHDYASDEVGLIVSQLDSVGVHVLGLARNGEDAYARFSIQGVDVGVAGVKGFGGGFGNKRGANFGEPIQRAFMTETIDEGKKLLNGLYHLMDCETRIVLTHYAPISGTVRNEHVEIWPWLGSSQLLYAARRGDASVCFHGHAHRGPLIGHSENIKVRNVAYDNIPGRDHLMNFSHTNGWSDITGARQLLSSDYPLS